MSRGKMLSSNSNGGTANAGGSPSSTQNPAMARRGNKTLAWYISDKILDKNELERDSSSPLPAGVRVVQNAMTNRKGSMDSESSMNSSKNIANGAFDEDKRRHREKCQQRPRSRRSANGRAEKDAFVKEQSNEEHFANGIRGHFDPRAAQNGFAAGVAKERKEDYWYYDAKSDGFYYEFNGSRGWRKRNPKLHGPGGVPLANVAFKGIGEGMEAPQKPGTSVPQQTSKFFPTATAANIPNIKYYDAASDGFFYEMASVDGWRRRQPIGSNGVSPPNSFYTSQPQHQGQSQQRVIRPMQPIGRPLQGSTQQSPVGREGIGDSPSPGLHDRQMKQNLTNAELEDIIVQMMKQESGYSWNNSGTNGGSRLSCGNGSVAREKGETQTLNPLGPLYGLKDIEKIWQCPAF